MPKKIGKYELGQTLGTGNFSKVKVGIDDKGQKWAVKIIDKAQLAREHMEEQLKREIAVMKVLKHENIVQMHEVLQTSNHIYLILEVITGGELFDRIVAAKRFEEPVARRYFQQLILGTYYCHEQGIAHRDLKPENLLLDGNDVLKISDFGLSNLQRTGPQGGGALLQTVCGTPNYVAPEVLREKGYNGFTADVWSCGVILFVMLAGYLPFDDPNMNHLFNKIERGDYRMAKNFSDSAKDLISKLLVVDAAKRLTLDQILAHPWMLPGLDMKAFERAKTKKVSVSSEEVKQAMGTVADPTKQKRESVSTASTGLDAFDIMSRFTVGSLNPLTSGSHGLVRTTTRFMFGGPGAEIKEIISTLEQLKANPKQKDGLVVEIKGFMNAPKGLMTYNVMVIPTVASTLFIVEVRRGRGDTLDFHEFFRGLQSALGSRTRSREIGAR